MYTLWGGGGVAFYVDFLLTEVYTNEAVRLEGWPNTAAQLARRE